MQYNTIRYMHNTTQHNTTITITNNNTIQPLLSPPQTSWTLLPSPWAWRCTRRAAACCWRGWAWCSAPWPSFRSGSSAGRSPSPPAPTATRPPGGGRGWTAMWGSTTVTRAWAAGTAASTTTAACTEHSGGGGASGGELFCVFSCVFFRCFFFVFVFFG